MTHNEAIQEELTAYLDGELSSEARRRVEERLAREPEYRAELQRLQRPWDLLEQLPRATVDESFARTTIEMVAVAAAEEARSQALAVPRQRRQRLVLGSLAVLLAAVLGFGLGVRTWPDRDAQLLRDLPVVENFELYRQVDSLEFLHKLDESGLFNEESTDGR